MESQRDDERASRLIASAQRGDARAFNELAAAVVDGIYTVAYRTVGRTDLAADVVQETLLSAFHHIRSFRGGSFRAWLTRIAVNKSYDALRSIQRRREDPIDNLAPGDDEPTGPTTPDDPVETALAAELRRHLQAGLRELPVDQRTAVVLFDVEGYSYEEIAYITGVAVGTVKSRISRGRARLRELLAQHRELFGRPERPPAEDPEISRQ